MERYGFPPYHQFFDSGTVTPEVHVNKINAEGPTPLFQETAQGSEDQNIDGDSAISKQAGRNARNGNNVVANGKQHSKAGKKMSGKYVKHTDPTFSIHTEKKLESISGLCKGYVSRSPMLMFPSSLKLNAERKFTFALSTFTVTFTHHAWGASIPLVLLIWVVILMSLRGEFWKFIDYFNPVKHMGMHQVGTINVLDSSTGAKPNWFYEVQKQPQNVNLSLRNMLETDYWPLQHVNNPYIKQQPHPPRRDIKYGKKYRVAGILNGTFVELQLDCGAFVSAISLQKAKELGLTIVDGPSKTAGAANGSVEFKKQTTTCLDIGALCLDVTFMVMEHDSWRPDMILLGASLLETVKAKLDFDKNYMLLYDRYPIRMFTSSGDLRRYVDCVKVNYISNKRTPVLADRLAILKPNESKSVKIKLDPKDRLSLQNTDLYFCADIQTNGCEARDLFIDKKFPWHQSDVEITITNTTNLHKIVRENDIVGSFKPVIFKKCTTGLAGINSHSKSNDN